MSPLYHLQVGSFFANAGVDNQRDRRLVMLAALAPDADGIFFFNPGLWERFHHTFGHNIFFALFIGAVFGALARGSKTRVGLLAAATALLQVGLDNFTNDPTWKIMYFWPISHFDFALGNFIDWTGLAFFLVWVVQGSLMVAILVGTVWLYRRTGRTFLELFSPRLDRLLTDFIVLPFTAKCSVCGARASYRVTGSQDPVCGRHGRVRLNFTVLPLRPAPSGESR
jgi:hypothetical protein